MRIVIWRFLLAAVVYNALHYDLFELDFHALSVFLLIFLQMIVPADMLDLVVGC